MNSSLVNTKINIAFSARFINFLLAGLLVVLIFLFLSLNIDLKYIVVIASIPLLLIISFNFRLTAFLLLISLFVNFNLYYFSISELLSVILFFSLIITHTFGIEDIYNPIAPTLTLFILSILPSIYMLSKYPAAIPGLLHLVFFIFIIYSFYISTNTYRTMKMLLITYLCAAFLNSIDLIFTAVLTGNRVFGFAGIMFVDYVGIAIIITYVTLIMKRKKQQIAFMLFLIFVTALIFTQTRSIWIIVGIVLVLITIHSITKYKEYSANRKKIIFFAATVIIVLLLILLVLPMISPEIFKRVAISKIKDTNDPGKLILQMNSLVSRFFIWLTAWNAFLSSPFIGIGLYGFPFASKEFATVDPILFKIFVAKLTPHETFLALLTETGVVGTLGFLSFLSHFILLSKKNIKLATGQQEKFYSILLFWIAIYILFSMLITDAWLWGHGIVLLGFIIALSTANRKIILNNQKPSVNK